MSKATITPAEFERRAAALLGGWGWKTRWATSLDYRPDHVSRTLSPSARSAIPVAWVAILEMLEALPPDQWPLRWQR